MVDTVPYDDNLDEPIVSLPDLVCKEVPPSEFYLNWTDRDPYAERSNLNTHHVQKVAPRRTKQHANPSIRRKAGHAQATRNSRRKRERETQAKHYGEPTFVQPPNIELLEPYEFHFSASGMAPMKDNVTMRFLRILSDNLGMASMFIFVANCVTGTFALILRVWNIQAMMLTVSLEIFWQLSESMFLLATFFGLARVLLHSSKLYPCMVCSCIPLILVIAVPVSWLLVGMEHRRWSQTLDVFRPIVEVNPMCVTHAVYHQDRLLTNEDLRNYDP